MTRPVELLEPTIAAASRFDNAIGLVLGALAVLFLVVVLVFPERF